MKKVYVTPLFVLSFVFAFAQNQFSKDFEAIRTELVTWDAVRGEWLANSFEAMVSNQAIPDRTFPEDLTPGELFKMVPKNHQQAVRQIVSTNQTAATEPSQRSAWRRIAVITETSSCRPIAARSYGDPHLVSFDGARFSFQTVGEFVMTKSTSGHMEVQTRQRAQGNDVSLNTAVAMNVAGDRLCLYANEKPDNDRSTLFRLNGSPIRVEQNTYNLPHGGTIVRNGRNDFIVNWPSGERVILDVRNSGSFDFVNVNIEIVPCNEEAFNGVLGNANNRVDDDFITRSGRNPKSGFSTFVMTGNSETNRIAQQMEREHLAFITKDFADDWRVTPETTLFDYGFGENTFTYTDLTYPRVHRTLDDLTPDQRNAARERCRQDGIPDEDMNGCIYDQGFVNLPSSPKPVVKDRTEGVVLTKVERPVPVKTDVPESRKPEGTGIENRKETEKKDADVNAPKTERSTSSAPTKERESKSEEKKDEDVKIWDVIKPSSEKKSEKSPSKSESPTPKTESSPTPVKKSEGSSGGSSSKSTPTSTPKTTPTPPAKSTPTPTPTPKTTPTSTPVKKGKG